MFKSNCFPSLALAIGIAATPVLAQAQSQGQGYSSGAPQQMQQAPSAAAIPETKLEAFAAAEGEVQQIAQDLESRLRETQSPDEQQEIQEQAYQRVMDAVKDEGLTPEEYNMIYRAAIQDPAVRDAVRSHQ